MGKLWLLTSALEGGRLSLLVIAALNSIISLAYYWKVIRTTFIHSDVGLEPISVPLLSQVVLGLSIVGVVAIGVYPNLVLRWAESAIQVFVLP